ncbi:MAG: LytR C-terminal domain-containing protein [Candidatus Moraniibacteriota bacterium]
MPEMEPEDNVVSDNESQEEIAVPQVENIPQTSSRESLWGALLFTSMLLFVIASIVSIIWIGYSQWKDGRVADAKPSITVLSEKSDDVEKSTDVDTAKTTENESAKQVEEKTSASESISAKRMAIVVLNGGAAKGSAGIIATFLKGEGYVSVTAGNTLKDYENTVVYYASGLEKEANSIKTSLIKKFPKVTILPADVKNKETSASQITVILGRQ